MQWSDFKSKLDALLAVERRRLGIQPSIDQQIRLGVGDVQRLLDHYRTGIVTTFDHDDLQRDGHASKGRIPSGANLREAYHVKTGTIWVRRPLRPYEFSNRNDLRAGVVDFGEGNFRIAIDHRGSRDFWVYPRVTPGYAVQFVWDAILGRGDIEYADTDWVPFDEPVIQLVYDWVKRFLSVEVDKDPKTAQVHELNYRKGIATLYSETQERLRIKHAVSDAECVPEPCGRCHNTPCSCGLPMISCDGTIPLYPDGTVPICPDGYPVTCPEITMPQTSWVMFGDSGERSVIADTIAVATSVQAYQPEFILHLGDASYPTSQRPGYSGSSGSSVPSSAGGSAHILHDLFVKHYWNFIRAEKMYIAFGNHDLETDYGRPTLNVLPNVEALIGQENLDREVLMYEFASGPVRFFVLNSGWGDDDTNIRMDIQTPWLQERVAAAAEPWLLVVFHRPAYTSDSSHHPGSALMKTLTDQLPAMGVDLVVCAHGHNYERIMDPNGLTHVICGLGGAYKRGQADPVTITGSQFFYSTKNGFLSFTADNETLKWEFRTVDNQIVDSMVLAKEDSGFIPPVVYPETSPPTSTSAIAAPPGAAPPEGNIVGLVRGQIYSQLDPTGTYKLRDWVFDGQSGLKTGWV